MFEFDWKYFSTRPDIVKLPINEQKRLFFLEQQNYNNRITYYLNSVFSSTAGSNTNIPNPINEIFTINNGEVYIINGDLIINGTLIISSGGELIIKGSIIENGIIINNGLLTIIP